MIAVSSLFGGLTAARSSYNVLYAIYSAVP